MYIYFFYVALVSTSTKTDLQGQVCIVVFLATNKYEHNQSVRACLSTGTAYSNAKYTPRQHTAARLLKLLAGVAT